MAYALKKVVTSGTAAGMNPSNTDMLAKTGTTDNNEQIWLVAATTKMAGAYWVGNISGHVSMRSIYPTHGTTPALARTAVMRNIMGAAVAKFGGDPFPTPDNKLLQGVQVQVPDLSGRSPAEAKSIIEGLGLNYADGGPRDSMKPAGTVDGTDPGAGANVTRAPDHGVHEQWVARRAARRRRQEAL